MLYIGDDRDADENNNTNFILQLEKQDINNYGGNDAVKCTDYEKLLLYITV